METATHHLNQNKHWSPNDHMNIGKVNHHQRLADCLFSIKEETRGLLLKTIVTVASAMIAVIHKQMTDFFDGGKIHVNHVDAEQLLKRNTISILKWLIELKPENRDNIMFSARKGDMTIYQVKTGIKRECSALKRGKTNRHKVSDDCQDIGYEGLTYIFREHEYVAIAYQDPWYPGIAEKVKDENSMC
ncbi:hypothetical protein CHS0354_012499 [Potamilus streckersoni]|uniref:Uncharacterized protein n=1 Tax=Potamilus streckersoni TaxID=2493646 RepID=A0AAE0SWN4_9BIVA|nr:hypothetical protein CHS0354_012499 [Potamilus streckersoni]